MGFRKAHGAGQGVTPAEFVEADQVEGLANMQAALGLRDVLFGNP